MFFLSSEFAISLFNNNEDESTLGNAVGAKLSDEQAKAQKTKLKDVRSLHKVV